MECVDGPSGQERCLGSSLMIIIAYQAIGVEKTVFEAHFQGSRQVLLNTLMVPPSPVRVHCRDIEPVRFVAILVENALVERERAKHGGCNL